MKRRLKFFSLVSLCLILSACQQKKPVTRFNHPIPEDAFISEQAPGCYGGIMVASIDQEPKTFNPLMAVDAYSQNAQKLLFASLLEFDYENQRLCPALAKNYEITNNQTYRFYLRQGLCWSDGQPFTADDVVFTFDVLLTQTIDSSGKKHFRYPSTLGNSFVYDGQPLRYKKLGTYAVEFETPLMWASFLEDISNVYILPKHKLLESYNEGTLQQQWTLQTAIEKPQDLVGMGPFCIHKFRPGERLVVVPNPHFWKVDKTGQRLPYIDYYVTQYVENVSVQTILFATGQTDAAPIYPSDVAWVKKMEQVHDFKLYHRGPDAYFGFFWFNQNPGVNEKGQPYVLPYKLRWFQNCRFRQAVLYGLDREGIVQARFFGRGEVLHSFISRSDTRWYNPNVKKYPYAPLKAKSLLRQAGFHWDDKGKLWDAFGNRVSFEVSWATAGTDGFITTFKDNMEALGIEVKIVSLDFNALLDVTQRSYRYESAVIGSRTGRDPNRLKNALKSDGAMHIWFPNQKSPTTDWEKEVDALFERQARILDETERKRCLDRMQEILSEKVPWLPLITPHHYTGIKNKWKNLRIPSKGSILWNIEEIWCEQKR